MAKTFTNLKEARKGLALPGGKAANISEWDGRQTYTWNKRGGYADKVFQKLFDSLRKARWTETDSRGFGNPDGSVMGNVRYWTKGGWIVSVNKSIGGTKWDNSFQVDLKQV